MSQEKEYQASLKGQFLIAMPSLADPNFSQAVTYICEHTTEGAVGLVINRIHQELTMEAVFKELNLEFIPERASLPIHLGGPVHPGQIFILHGPPFDWEACRPVTPSLALSNSKDLLEALAKGQGPEPFIITLGCAGWAPNQLESEIMANAWLTCPASETILFETPVEKRWEKAANLMGIDPRRLTDTAGHA
ncbi:MAG: YqgE/AlgH family protein [Deltaproteobacteria bacterium]|nr:YqgE/AlgH family protein [Deltaproteobacteria bacterium]MBW2019236.1 YqgE/AlgH family protein [Deltaproteobacteria bacterium]MBW2074042.1 YqgE/AlgH family protein [Deltaproteobacteria bacterium]RLB82485.1 MAG: YqgE/AlgH family protein [Deltaproteobacteria bacterium]